MVNEEETPLIKKQDELGNGSRFSSAAVLAFFAKLAGSAKEKLNFLSQLIGNARKPKEPLMKKSSSKGELFAESDKPVEEEKSWRNTFRPGPYSKI